MCIADTSTVPSVTPLAFTIAAISSVMRMNSWRCLRVEPEVVGVNHAFGESAN